MSILTLFIIRNDKADYFLITLGIISIEICFFYYLNDSFAPTEFRIRTESAVSFVFLSAGYNLLKKNENITFHPLLPVLTLIGAFLCYLNSMPDWLSFSLAPVLLALTINHLHEATPLLRGILELKVFRLMGVWSFSIYLWQQPFYKFSWKIPGHDLVSMFLAIAIGTLSFYLYEQPIRSWINNRWTKNI
jgi:peptidoglycan/LPS O-acetylase OafA/YrhL